MIALQSVNGTRNLNKCFRNGNILMDKETRIGKNRKEGTNDNLKESHEIFIICPPPQ